MAKFFAILCAAACLSAPRAVAAPQALLVVEESDAAGQALGRSIKKQLEDKVDFRWLSYSADSLGNPIHKGKLLAVLSAAKLIVSVGDEATGLVLGELEDVPIYFVGASAVSGADLSLPQVAGVLGYSVDDVLSASPEAWSRGLGLLYAPGYEPIVEEVAAKAQSSGVKLLKRRIVRPKELPPAARALMGAAKAVWVLGDPMLSRGAGFDFLAEESLLKNVPLVSAGPSEVRHGAVFCSEAAQSALTERASQGIASLLETGQTSPRIETAPGGGRIVFHKGLAARYGLSPKAPSWVESK